MSFGIVVDFVDFGFSFRGELVRVFEDLVNKQDIQSCVVLLVDRFVENEVDDDFKGFSVFGEEFAVSRKVIGVLLAEGES